MEMSVEDVVEQTSSADKSNSKKLLEADYSHPEAEKEV